MCFTYVLRTGKGLPALHRASWYRIYFENVVIQLIKISICLYTPRVIANVRHVCTKVIITIAMVTLLTGVSAIKPHLLRMANNSHAPFSSR